MMGERLLTRDEIDSILKESVVSKYHVDKLFHIGGQLTTIQKISNKTGLILIIGNDSTGLEHIMLRHDLTSKAGHWNPVDKNKLDDPSKFSLETIPLFDFLAIADSIYKVDNKVIDDKNNRPDTFDLYIGEYINKDSNKLSYRLLLYRDTPIIHNLFPEKKIFNKKKILNLQQLPNNSSFDLIKGIQTYNISYCNSMQIERAKVIIRLRTYNGTEDWNIQINDNYGRPFFTHMALTKTVENAFNIPSRMTSLDYRENLSEIEKTIKKLLKEIE